MSNTRLLNCLREIPAPASIEEWLLPSEPTGEELPNAAYREGVIGLLAGLGVLNPQTGEAISPQAYYFVRSLIAGLQDASFGEAMWDDDKQSLGMRLLHLLETTRLEQNANATPLRVVRASTAVIKSRLNGGDVYLMQYDAKAGWFQPIGGKQELTDAGPEAALARELAEELNIPQPLPGRDFTLHPLAVDVAMNEVSASLHVITRYYHSFYHLRHVRFALPTDSQTRWVTGTELAAGTTHDGHPITALYETYIPGVLPTLEYSL